MVIIEFGKRSITDIKIITVPENAKTRLIFDFLPILGINTSKEPKSVPNDAKNDNKIGINIDINLFLKYSFFIIIKNILYIIIVGGKIL